jgi:hypothetical protein
VFIPLDVGVETGQMEYSSDVAIRNECGLAPGTDTKSTTNHVKWLFGNAGQVKQT